ncbi:GntR family transcriptional regulator, partial [Corynebacterium diphtheriae]|uniref:GntR family transcriptional regulator n=1 Tax=Corynebacterium diphtheriae TaxID=1717 RepID=UPI00105468CD
MRPDLVTNLPITLNRASADPIPTQIADHIRTLVGRGLLKPSDHVPSTRALSTQLDISRGSAVTAYEQLLAEGFLIAARGSGTCINPDLTPTPCPLYTSPSPRDGATSR